MEPYTNQLIEVFRENANPTIAVGQKAYMRNQFEFLGIKAQISKEIQKPFLLKQNLPEKQDLEAIVKVLWLFGFRELNYFAQQLASKYKSKFEKKDIELLEFMILNDSWWDTVDYISVHLLGSYFLKFPEEKEKKVEEWIDSNNLWLQRCAILFQLKYKSEIDTDLLVSIINRLQGSKEFFINKAIGWILREISKTEPIWVQEFVSNQELSNLSLREALRLIKN